MKLAKPNVSTQTKILPWLDQVVKSQWSLTLKCSDMLRTFWLIVTCIALCLSIVKVVYSQILAERFKFIFSLNTNLVF